MSERFDRIPKAPRDKLMLANAEWKQDWADRPDAINTTIGVILNPETGATYRNPSVIRSMRRAHDEIDNQELYSYQTSRGHQKFLDSAEDLVFGDDRHDLTSFQTEGGTGALYKTKRALLRLYRGKGEPTLVLDPGWPNHQSVFATNPDEPGFHIVTYPHADFETGTYNHAGALDALHSAPDGSVALFQVSGYNGDGLGRTHEEWNDVLDVAQSKNQAVILDAAYMGLTGTIEEDAYAISEARRRGLLTFNCISFSKNFGLYNGRIGALTIANAAANLEGGAEEAESLAQYIDDKVTRTSVSNPAFEVAHGAALVLTNEREAFFAELEQTRNRLESNRQVLAGILGKVAPIIANGSGLFTTLLKDGFTKEQMEVIKSHDVFPLENSRINIGGIHPDNITRVGNAILDAVSR